MDLAALLGILVAIVSLTVAFVIDGGQVLALIAHPSALMVVLGGTIGMTMTGFPMRRITSMHKILASAFTPKVDDAGRVVEALVAIAEKARKEGLLALQDDVSRLDNPLLSRGLTMIVDGVDPDDVRRSLEQQVSLERSQQNGQAAVLEAAGGYSPTAGIIGTVMGLILVLANLGGDMSTLGQGISTAFMATFYGVLFANVFWLPLANKIKAYAKEREELGRLIISGLVALQSGENPRSIREKLIVYLQASRGITLRVIGSEE